MAVNEGPFSTLLEFDVPDATELGLFEDNVDSIIDLIGGPDAIPIPGLGNTPSPLVTAHPDFSAIKPSTRVLLINELLALKAIANSVI